jgi:hypothetical protein
MRKKMSAQNFFRLGERIGRLKNIIDVRMEEIVNDNILWGTPTTEKEKRNLVEALRIINCIKYEVEFCTAKPFCELCKMYDTAESIWYDTADEKYKC